MIPVPTQTTANGAMRVWLATGLRWSRSFGQKFRFAKWIVCRG